MLYLRSFNRFFLISLALLGLSVSSVSATYVYTYTGDNFDTFFDSPRPAGASSAGCMSACNFNASSMINGSFVLDTPLLPIQFSGLIIPSHYTFTAGIVTISDTTPNQFISNFFIATDINGDITDWHIEVATGSSYSGIGSFFTRIETRSQSFYFDQGRVQECVSEFILLGLTLCRLYLNDDAYNESSPGTWSVSSAPVPAAVWLFGTGILGLIGFSKRKAILKAA